jgi:hypothetical protein
LSLQTLISEWPALAGTASKRSSVNFASALIASKNHTLDLAAEFAVNTAFNHRKRKNHRDSCGNGLRFDEKIRAAMPC